MVVASRNAAVSGEGSTERSTGSDTPPSRWSSPLGAGLALAGVLMLLAAISIWIGRSPGWGYDFWAYYDAAIRFVQTGTPYEAETLSGPFRPGAFGLYLYSPVLALLFVPLTALGDQAAIMVWLGIRIAILVLACALMPVPRAVRLATFGVAGLSAPVLYDLDLGNVSLFVTFVGVLAWRWMDRPVAGVALAAALMVRPTMALIAAWWLLRGVWRPAVAVVAAAALIVLATLPVVGLDRWFEYLTVLRNVSDVTGVRSNVDLGSSLLLLGGPAWAAPIALFAGYVVAASACLYSLRRDRELSFVVTMMATVLLAPLLWDHYLTNLLVPAAFLASRGRAWGLALPLLCWAPALLEGLNPALQGPAEGILPYVALVGLLVPFAAPDRGERAGTFLDRFSGRLSTGPARA